MRLIPVDNRSSDWPRKVAEAVNALIVWTRRSGFAFTPEAEPSSPAEGQAYFDATSKKLRVWDGTAWQDCW